VFQDGDRLFSLQRGQFSWAEETNVSLYGKPSLSEAAAFSTLFPYENWVSDWKEYFLQIKTFQVRKVIFIQIGLFKWEDKKTCLSQKKSSRLKTGASSTFFPYKDWLSYWKDYFLQIKTFQVRNVILIQIGIFTWDVQNMFVNFKNLPC
jgi:hypothetical protein